MKALYTLPQSAGIAGGGLSSSYFFSGSQADNLFYLSPHHTYTRDRPLAAATQQTQMQTTEHGCERGIPIRQATPERGSVTPLPQAFSVPQHRMCPAAKAHHSPSSLSKQLSTSGSFSGGGAQVLNSAGANGGGGGSILSGEAASDAGLDTTQTHYVTLYSAAKLRTFHCERVREMPLSGLNPSMLIGILCKTGADWVDLRRAGVTEVRIAYLL